MLAPLLEQSSQVDLVGGLRPFDSMSPSSRGESKPYQVMIEGDVGSDDAVFHREPILDLTLLSQ